jgi:hypothetical protein
MRGSKVLLAPAGHRTELRRRGSDLGLIRPLICASTLQFYRSPAAQNKAFVPGGTLKILSIALLGALAT